MACGWLLVPPPRKTLSASAARQGRPAAPCQHLDHSSCPRSQIPSRQDPEPSARGGGGPGPAAAADAQEHTGTRLRHTLMEHALLWGPRGPACALRLHKSPPSLSSRQGGAGRPRFCAPFPCSATDTCCVQALICPTRDPTVGRVPASRQQEEFHCEMPTCARAALEPGWTEPASNHALPPRALRTPRRGSQGE